MITLKNINLSSIDLSGIDLRGIKLGLGGRGGGSGDGFPQLPGDVTRWHFGGLTNEMMAAMDDPRIEDADHKGRFLSFKNLAWKGMSGVGGYAVDIDEWGTNSTAAYFERNSIKITATFKENASLGLLYHNIKLRQSCVLKVTGIPKGCDAFLDDRLGNRFYMSEDGVYEIIPSNFLAEALYLSIEKYPERWYGSKLTIEQLPLYPGFILGDGVDDFAVTEKELNFEDTYTVYTAFIPFQSNPTRNMILCGANSKKTFSMQYSSLVYVSFIAGNNYYINADFVNGLNLFVCKRNGNNICIKNLLTNKVVTGTCGDWVENAGLYYLWKNATYASFAKAAIAGQTICNGYFSTDEDDEKVLDWYKKQYPWLFPDQAWTVVGKTNEDEDRATIANITGNGNDLVLSNFGFAEGSGYGLYAYNFNSFNLKDNVVKPTDVKKDSFRIIGTGDNSNVLVLLNESDSADWKIRITGMKEGDRCLIGNANKSGEYIIVTKDGTYTFQKQYVATSTNGIWYNSSQEVDVLVEQIPEYEGYLVTDGVDDKITSSAFEMGKDFTVVGEWRFIIDERKVAGLIKPPSFYLFNENNGLKLFINNTEKSSSLNTKSLKAICSDGRVYFDDWSEMLLSEEQPITSSSKDLSIGYNSTIYTQMAFKNLGIYNDQLLSKDDCIKAYNYLQTLKAK